MKLFVLLLAAAALRCGSEDDDARGEPLVCDTPPLEIFEQRIEPLLADDNPKSCNQCHLSGVDFSSFVRDTPCETMACLVEGGLVALDAPEESKILGWIRRAEPDSALITEDVIQAEHDGFLEWIEASARCPDACGNRTCGSPSTELACEIETEPEELPEAPEPDCADSSLEELFQNDVFAWRGRCFPCHFDNQPAMRPEAPRWIRTQGSPGFTHDSALPVLRPLLLAIDYYPRALFYGDDSVS
jgi:hypothetical protein